MFGPNPYPEIKTYCHENHSHRDNYFVNLYKECKNLFSKKFNLNEYEIVFITGPATLAMEIILSSVEYNVNVEGVNGKFKKRWQSLSEKYRRHGSSHSLSLVTHFETSNSTYNKIENYEIVDAVSSFPFIDLKKENQIVVTTVNKIIGSLAGISVILLRKNNNIRFKKFEEYSFLDFSMHLEYARVNQTPCTACVYLFETLKNTLLNFDKKKTNKKIKRNCKLILEALGLENNFLPAVTFKKNAISTEIINCYKLYGYNNPKSENLQIFTYSESCHDYLKLAKEIKKDIQC